MEIQSIQYSDELKDQISLIIYEMVNSANNGYDHIIFNDIKMLVMK